MKILIAEQNRDFLKSYQKLLSISGHSVETVFDGTQLLRKSREACELVILGEDLPRIDRKRLLKHLKEEGILSLMLLKGGLSTGLFLEDALPSAYLRFPFAYGELAALTDEIAVTAAVKDKVECKGFSFVPGDFELAEGCPICLEELRILQCAAWEEQAQGKHLHIYVAALNKKLERLGIGSRISYSGTGSYRFVPADI